MTFDQLIPVLSVLALAGSLIALIYIIMFFYRANRLLNTLEDIPTNLRHLLTQLVPAVVNVGTIAKAVESLVHTLYHDGNRKVAPNRRLKKAK